MYLQDLEEQKRTKYKINIMYEYEYRGWTVWSVDCGRMVR